MKRKGWGDILTDWAYQSSNEVTHQHGKIATPMLAPITPSQS